MAINWSQQWEIKNVVLLLTFRKEMETEILFLNNAKNVCAFKGVGVGEANRGKYGSPYLLPIPIENTIHIKFSHLPNYI